MENVADCFCRTSVQEQNYKFKWTVENVSKLPRSITINSCDFFIDERDASWFVSLVHLDSYVSFSLMGGSSSTALKVVAEVRVLDSNNKVYYENTAGKYKADAHGTVSLNFTPIESTTFDELKMAPNDTWHFIFIIKIYKMVTKVSSETPTQQMYEEKSKNFYCANTWKMFKNKLGTDVTLQIKDRKIEAHKFVLRAQSPVFAKMFEVPMSESDKNTVVIDDISMAAMTELLHFMYSKAGFKYPFETAVELYYAADKYEVVEFREICGEILFSLITKDNAGVLLELADKHKDVNLKRKVMECINSNIKACIKTEWWHPFTGKETELVKELMTHIK